MRELLSKLLVMEINWKRVLRYALLLFLSLITQNMLFTQLRIAGICPLVLPAVVVAVGMFEGPVWGAIFGLLLGVFGDMSFVENTVLFTLLFPVLSFAAGFLAQFFINRRFFAFMGAATLGLLVTGFVQLLHTSAGDGFSMLMINTVLLQTLWSLPFAPLAYLSAARWID